MQWLTYNWAFKLFLIFYILRTLQRSSLYMNHSSHLHISGDFLRILGLKSLGSSVSYILKAFASYSPVAFGAGVTNMQLHQEFILTGKAWHIINNYFSSLNMKLGCFHSAYCTTIFCDLFLYVLLPAFY